jgi:hypothetical protein
VRLEGQLRAIGYLKAKPVILGRTLHSVPDWHRSCKVSFERLGCRRIPQSGASHSVKHIGNNTERENETQTFYPTSDETSP